MKILLINAVMKFRRHDQPPYGLLYVAGALLGAGHEVEIYDPDVSKASVAEVVKLIEDKRPDAVGLSGCITGYYYHKPLSIQIKKLFPHITIVAGGSISSIPNLLLNNACVDVVVTGEGEITATQLFDCLEKKRSYEDVCGIAFKKNGKIHFTPAQKQISPLDDIPFPPYHLLNIEDYLFDPSTHRRFSQVFDIENFIKEGKKVFSIKTARGCTHRCSFCYRHMHGIRQHSVDYTIALMKHLYDNYNVGLFEFDDDLFTSSKKWLKQFCEAVRDSGMKILFSVDGARVNTVNREILMELKNVGCRCIEYGIESGSQKMLDVMNKNVKVEDNLKALQLTKEVGLITTPQIIVGMPGEDDNTIRENLSLLKKSNIYPIAITFATAYPKTWLYEYALDKGLIQDEEAYILSLANASDFTLNFTEYSDRTVQRWRKYLFDKTEYHYLSSQKKYGTIFLKRTGLSRLSIVNSAMNVYNREGLKGVISRSKTKLFKPKAS